ncbi:hypothetical protein KR044_001711, partial [Drosophila immigrans]
KSHRDLWYAQNRSIIIALGRVLGLHADVVFDFLYALTLRNFGRVLNPGGHKWSTCRVPLSNVTVCEYYAGIFDHNGNVRNPFHPDVLQKLLAMMQQLLQQDKPDNPPEILSADKETKTARWGKRISDRAGIGPDSVARANGMRRRFQLGERYQLGGYQAALMRQSWDSYAKGFPQLWRRKARLEVAKDIVRSNVTVQDWAELEDRDERDWTPQQRMIRDTLYDLLYENLSAARSRELKLLLQSVKQQTGFERDLPDVLSAVRQLDLSSAVQGEQAHLKRVTLNLSQQYNAMAQKPDAVIGKPKATQTRLQSLTESEPSSDLGARQRFYYGEQVPTLMHEPFDPKSPRTWIRRHPGAMRVDDRGRIRTGGVERRYKGSALRRRLEVARKKYSVHSEYSGSDVSAQDGRSSRFYDSYRNS